MTVTSEIRRTHNSTRLSPEDAKKVTTVSGVKV